MVSLRACVVQVTAHYQQRSYRTPPFKNPAYGPARQLFNQEWKVKPRRGRQRKPWNKYVDKLFDVLELPKGELLDDIRKGNVH